MMLNAQRAVGSVYLTLLGSEHDVTLLVSWAAGVILVF